MITGGCNCVKPDEAANTSDARKRLASKIVGGRFEFHVRNTRFRRFANPRFVWNNLGIWFFMNFEIVCYCMKSLGLGHPRALTMHLYSHCGPSTFVRVLPMPLTTNAHHEGARAHRRIPLDCAAMPHTTKAYPDTLDCVSVSMATLVPNKHRTTVRARLPAHMHTSQSVIIQTQCMVCRT